MSERKICPTCYKMGVVNGEGPDAVFYCTKGCGATYHLDSKGEADVEMVYSGRR